jgi:acetyl esterase/lipase
MSRKDVVGKVIKREITRAILERTQSMDFSKTMSMLGRKEPVVYEDVKETLNVASVNRDEVALAMDIFEPADAQGKELPVILAIHGGGLFMGDRGLERPYCRLLAHKGYLVFSIEYRLAPKANLCEQLDDVCAGLDYVGSMLVNYDVDFSRIFLVADSAGAYLAAYVSAMHDSEKLQSAIGQKPSRMVYAAVGFISGMFYTRKALQEQIYGDKRHDERFLKYMNIEDPEIVENMPPAFLITSCGDVFNNYSIKFNKVLKKHGRTSKLIYLGNEELQHVFPITNPEHPRSIEVTDKMLEWFDEQADCKRDRYKKEVDLSKKRKQAETDIKAGKFNDMKVWRSLKEMLSYDERMLKRTALIDCTRRYTYEQMYGEWECYAKVFSALDICADNDSRVALCGVISAEPVFALFGLNMTGAEVSLFSYLDFIPGGMWRSMLEKEKITDLIISDIMVAPDVREELFKAKEELGLRNVIYLHSLMGGPTVGPAELTYNELNYHKLRLTPGSVFMNELLEVYKDSPIKYDESKGGRKAFTTHSYGETKVTREAKTFTDKEFNKALCAIPGGVHSFAKKADDGKPMRVLQLFDLSSVMALSVQLCSSFAHGDTVVTTYFGFMHNKFIRAIDYYHVNLLMTTEFIMDKWLERNDLDDADLSSLWGIRVLGDDISPEKLDVYTQFFEKHGYKYSITSAEGNHEPLLGSDEEYRLRDEEAGFFGMFMSCDRAPVKKEEKKAFKMPEIPEDVMKAVLKYGNRVSGLSNGRRWIDHDFEA